MMKKASPNRKVRPEALLDFADDITHKPCSVFQGGTAVFVVAFIPDTGKKGVDLVTGSAFTSTPSNPAFWARSAALAQMSTYSLTSARLNPLGALKSGPGMLKLQKYRAAVLVDSLRQFLVTRNILIVIKVQLDSMLNAQRVFNATGFYDEQTDWRLSHSRLSLVHPHRR
jgi:hypothetical protein